MGDREPPKKKSKKRKKPDGSSKSINESTNDKHDSSEDESLSAAISLNHMQYGGFTENQEKTKRKSYKKSDYFSDEEDLV